MALNRKQQESPLLEYRLNLRYAYLKYYVINGYRYHAYHLPDEVAIGDCEFLPLEASLSRWATRVAQAIDQGRDLGRRVQGATLTRTAGFDITREADRLVRRYRTLAER